ncbi:MAG TPA: hypothetical protein VGF29_01590 [Hyphomicrobiaceae bacterium]
MTEHALIALAVVFVAVLVVLTSVVHTLWLRQLWRESAELVVQGQRHAALVKAAIEHLAALRGPR